MAAGSYAAPYGVSTFDLTIGTIVDMDEAIYMLSPADSPLLSGVDADGLSVLSSLPTDQKQVDWMTDALLTPQSALTANATTDQGYIAITADDKYKFSTGDILLVRTTAGVAVEYLRCTGYGSTTDTLTVSREWSGAPTKGTLTSGYIVIGIGQALREGANPEDSRAQDRVQYTNITQIFGPTKIQMSKTEQVIAKYGVPDEFSRQTFLRTKEMTIHREQAFLYGKKYNDTSNKLRTMAGLYPLVTTNTVSSSTSLNVTTLQTLQQTIYNAGGMPDRLIANPQLLAALNDTANTDRVRQTFDDPRRGRIPVMEVWTEFGPVTIVRNRWNAKSDALLFSRDQATRRVLRPLVMERLAKTGDSDSVMLVCEETLEFKGQEHAGKFTNLS